MLTRILSAGLITGVFLIIAARTVQSFRFVQRVAVAGRNRRLGRQSGCHAQEIEY